MSRKKIKKTIECVPSNELFVLVPILAANRIPDETVKTMVQVGDNVLHHAYFMKDGAIFDTVKQGLSGWHKDTPNLHWYEPIKLIDFTTKTVNIFIDQIK